MAVYALVTILRKELDSELSTDRMLPTIVTLLFVQVLLHELFTDRQKAPASSALRVAPDVASLRRSPLEIQDASA